ncbi:MAG: enoyl-CoA hydratase/isomerase family protein [Flammeovirgaceae bacterium]
METLKITNKGAYTIVQLNRGKVNAINHQLVTELRETMQSLADDSKTKGVILTGIPHFFSAGLDVIELYDYDEKQIEEFFIAFGSMYVELVQFPKALICAIPGHCPAGGCVIAMTADYRVMAAGEKYSIGLNEVAVNIQISQNLIAGYAFWMGHGKASQYILEGKLLKAQEAFEAGLVSEIAPMEEVLERAEKKMKVYLRANTEIFQNTKAKLRKPWTDGLVGDAKADLQEAITLWWKPEIRFMMKMFVDSLTKKKEVKKA